MKAEEVYNIAIYLPETELERLYTLLQKDILKVSKVKSKPIKKKLISEEDAMNYIMRVVFKLKT